MDGGVGVLERVQGRGGVTSSFGGGPRDEILCTTV